MIELKKIIEQELITVYKNAAMAKNELEKACLMSGALTLEWVLLRVKDLEND